MRTVVPWPICLMLLILAGCSGGGGSKEESPPGKDRRETDRGRNDPVKPPALSAADLKTWVTSGARVGRMRKDRYGELQFESKPADRAGDLLAFEFADATGETLRGVAVPEIPFGLVLSRTGGSVVAEVARFKTLQALFLTECTRVDQAGLRQLEKLPLQTLLVNPATLRPEDLALFATFPDLERLDLSTSPGVNDAALAHLKPMKNLRSLNLGSTSITGATLNALSNQSKLSVLDLSGAPLKTLAQVARLTGLQTLGLRGCSGVGDAMIGPVGMLTNLQRLDLAHTDITDTGLQKLLTLKKLRFLHVARCEGVSEASLAVFRKNNPGLSTPP